MSQEELVILLFKKLLDKFRTRRKRFSVTFTANDIRIAVYLYNSKWKQEQRLEYVVETDGTLYFIRDKGELQDYQANFSLQDIPT